MRDSSTLRLLTTFACLLTPTAAPLANLLDEESIPNVITAARLKQSRHEVPASVSVIDREMIIASGLRKIPELFRLIPGTFVGARDGWNYVVSYHGTNYRDSRRMQVLVDGRSVYQAGLATVDWNDIPLNIEDIERIEIVRGPATASYGANAFLGVINIITRHPADTNHLTVSAKQGSESTEDYLLQHGNNFLGGFYRISVASRRDDGFDINRDDENRRDSDNADIFNGRYEKSFNQFNWSAGFGYKKGWVTDDYSDIINVTPPNNQVEDYYISNKLDWLLSANHQQSIRYDFSQQNHNQNWIAEVQPALLGLNDNTSPLVRADGNENIKSIKHVIEFQDNYVLNENTKAVSGFNIKRNKVDSETFYGGKIISNAYQLFINIENKLTEKFTINYAASYEYEELVGKSFSPRVTMHYHFLKNHGIRFIYSEAIRNPDLLETSADWTYTGRNVRPDDDGPKQGVFIISASGNEDINPEYIKSREVGYYGHFPRWNLQWDVKLFSDRLDGLISDSVALERFSPSNDHYLNQKGIETEIDYRPNNDWLLHLSYAYIKSDSNSETEMSFTPKNSASALVSYNITSSTKLSISQYYTAGILARKNTFSRSDIRLAKTVNIKKSKLTISYSAQYRHDDNSELLGSNIYTNNLRQIVAIQLSY